MNKPVETIIEIICDCCGKSIKNEEGFGFEYLKLETHWGFMSNHDLEKWTAQVCEECVETKLTFIKFTKTNSITGSPLKTQHP